MGLDEGEGFLGSTVEEDGVGGMERLFLGMGRT